MTGGLLALLAIAAASQPARATGPWYVAPGGEDSDDCLSPATACATINSAIAKASSGDTIYVATGTYTDTGSAVVLLSKDMFLSGGWYWDGTLAMQDGMSIIEGEGARRGVFAKPGVTARAEFFVVQHGFSPGGGGGIFNDGILTIDNCSINHNAAHGGPGSNASGGGIHNNGTLNLNDSTIDSNTADGGGGGIFNARGAVTLNNSTVSHNTASDAGGGISGNGTLTLNNSTVSGNAATDGGGIYIEQSGTTAIVAAVDLNNCTVSNNTASQGGGIQSGESALPVTVTLQNTILAGNTTSTDDSPDCSGFVRSLGHNLIGNTSGCDLTRSIGDLTDVSANLAPLAGSPGYHPLLSGSPAIDAGNPASCLTTDQRGFARFGRCDIGAYEAQSSKITSKSTVLPGHQLTFTIAVQNGDTVTTKFRISDTLPVSLTYVGGSLAATSGSYGLESGILTWTGWITASKVVSIQFGTTVSRMVPLSTSIVNSAIISGGGEIITRTATVNVDGQVCNLIKYADNPVLSPETGGSWDEDDVWDPTVLKEGDGIYKMWYTGDAGPNPSQIGLAISINGVNWTRIPGNPVLSPGEAWEAGGVRVASVILDSGVYRMWYTGFDSSGIGRIGYAVSPDGIAWAKYSGNPVLDIGTPGSWEDDDVTEPSVIKENSGYRMWYEGYDGVTARIGHATSSDGVNWTRDPANPVLETGPPGDWDWLHVRSPSVVAHGGSYLLWYSGGTLPPALQTGYALSSNNRDWVRREMLIPEGDPATFDAKGTDHPSVIADGDSFQVWYTGMDDGGTYNIGYATAGMCEISTAPPARISVYLPVVSRNWRSGYPCPPDYTDDFEDPGSGWPVYANDDVEAAYIDGQYQIWLNEPSLEWLITPGAKATNFAVAVSARRATGTYGGYGIIFGINEDWSELYQVHIEADYYSIWRRSNETWIPLQWWTVSNHIKTGSSWNRLKVIRDGADIAAYVNDQHLITVTDDSFTGLRRIGLVAYSPSSGSLDVHFDDFALYPSSCGVSAAGLGSEMGKPGIRSAPVPPGRPRSRVGH